MRQTLLALVLLVGLVALTPAPSADAQGCLSYSTPLQGYLYGYCYGNPINGAVYPLNVPFGNTPIDFGFTSLNVPLFPSNSPFSALSYGFPWAGYPPNTGVGGSAGGGGGAGSGGGLGSLIYQGLGFPFNGYPYAAGQSVTYNGYMFPIFGFPGSFGYNAGSRRGFNPYATPDSYLKTLDAVVLPIGGYQLSWTTGTTFSNSYHEIFQCAESDTPLVACRSVGIVNAEVRTFGPVPGGYTYVVRSGGYSGLVGNSLWGSIQEAESARLPLPLTPPPASTGAP